MIHFASDVTIPGQLMLFGLDVSSVLFYPYFSAFSSEKIKEDATNLVVAILIS